MSKVQALLNKAVSEEKDYAIFALRMPPELRDRFKDTCEARGLSMSETARAAIEDVVTHLESVEAGPGKKAKK